MIKEIDKSFLRKVFKKRRFWIKKGERGKLIIIGGNKKYSGAPAFNGFGAMACLRSGVDIVEVIAPKRVADIIASFSPDLITYPLNCDYLRLKHLNSILEEVKDKNAFVIGCGLGREKETLSLVKKFLKKMKIPGVVDADALYAFNKNDKNFVLSNFVITPNEKEFGYIFNESVSEDLNKRISQVKKCAKEFKTTVVLKGAVGIVSNGEKVFVNKKNNVFMTKGGIGDILSGVIGSFIAQGNDLIDSSCAGLFLISKAGELTRKKNSFVSSDLLEKISEIVDSFSF